MLAERPWHRFSYRMMSELLLAHVKETPPSPRRFAENIPLALEHIIRQCLAKMPDDRYPSAAVALKDVQSLQAHQDVAQPYLALLDSEDKAFVGRDQECQQLEQAWEVVRKSRKPHLFVLRGEIGIGKTRLGAEFISHLIIEQGFKAVAGRSDKFKVPLHLFNSKAIIIFTPLWMS